MTEHPGAFVRQIINEAGLTIGQAATAMSVQRPHLTNIMNGKANVTRAIAYKLDALLGTDTDALARDLIDRQAAWDWEQDAPERLKARSEIKCARGGVEGITKAKAPTVARTTALPASVPAPATELKPVRKGTVPHEKRLLAPFPYRDVALSFRVEIAWRYRARGEAIGRFRTVDQNPFLNWLWQHIEGKWCVSESEKNGSQEVTIHISEKNDAQKIKQAFKINGGILNLDPFKEKIAALAANKKAGKDKASLNRKDMPKRLRVVVRNDKVIEDLKGAGWGQINLPPMERMPGGQQSTFDTLHPLTGEKVEWGRYGYVTILKANPTLDKLWQTANEDFLIVAHYDRENQSYGPTTVTDAFVMFKSDDDAVMFKMMAL